MAAKFAALESRLNKAVFAHLANTDATVNGVTKAAIFDAAYALGSVGQFGMSSSQPALTIATSDVPADPVGLPVMVNGASYLIAVHEPDGTGISRLLLDMA